MKLRKVTQTGVGASNYIPLETDVVFFICSMSALLTGTATFTIEATFDNVFATDFNPSTANWVPWGSNNFSNLTASTVNLLTAQNRASAARVFVSSGTGTVVLSLRQGGIG